jgi:methionine-rich copper-binding protein CopC
MPQKRLLLVLAALLLSILAFITSAVFFQPTIAYAHAYVIGSDPIDGSTVSSPPAKIQIFFNAPISSASTAHVYVIENGQQVALSINAITVDQARQLTIALKDPEHLPQGSYEITWTAVANDDGHTTYGVIGFNAGQPSTGLSGTATLGPTTSNQLDKIRDLNVFSILMVAWDWFALLALTLWIGILVSEHLIVAKVARLDILTTKIKKRLQSLQWLCLSTLFFSEIVLLYLRINDLTHSPESTINILQAAKQIVLDSNYGYLWLARMLFLLLSFALLARRISKQGTIVIPEKVARTEHRTGPLRTRELPEIHTTGTANLTKERVEIKRTTTTPTPIRDHPYIWLFLGGLILLTYALSNETTQLQPTPISATVIEWLRLAAQGIWFGGLAYLAFLLLPVLPNTERDPHAETFTLLLQRFTPLLAGSLGMYLLADLYQGEASISTLEQLTNDPYGRTLLVQSSLLLIVFVLSIYILFWLRIKLTRQALLLPVVTADLPARRTRQTALGQTEQSLKRIIKICALPGAAILLCSALMLFYTPPIKFPAITYSNPLENAASANPTQSKQVGGLTITLQVLPAKAGSENIALVTLTDQQGNPVSDASVQLRTNMQIMDMGVATQSIAPGRAVYATMFAKSEAFSMAGLWTVTVKVQRPGQSALQTSFQVNVT